MSVRSGTHELGPEQATLSVRTKKAGAAAAAGHDLLIRVTDWRATLTVGDDPAATGVELSADPTSLKVIEGSGGMGALGDDDKANIEQTIDGEVLEGRPIEFRSTGAGAGAEENRITVEGELGIGDRSGPIGFELEIGPDGALAASATVKQSDWGIKPYSALFGALKVRDEVEVVLEGRL